ncbi:MBL fold metallo-hydrolase [Caldalkalibacillus salinus]|uniref:MBL fold metallo-hydrolase n=1 Tax=Caldalkalibacillus salinus TaxID=2803787 RepID=UPI00192481D2|nr:MBL fold metallo-hydrolase [Caldalkalibacillus salinus]
MNLWMEPLGPLQTNGYVLSNDQKQGIIIDPGMNPEAMVEHVQDLDIKAILLTHAHFDHIAGLEHVRQQTGAPVYIHNLEQKWLTDPDLNGSSRWSMVTEPVICQPRDQGLEDGQALTIAGIDMKVMHTPGHSPGSVSFYIEQENLVIAGDTLFSGSIGRTDLPGGDHVKLLNSIRAYILTLPEETIVYPGHGPQTTVGQEKAMNPFLNER